MLADRRTVRQVSTEVLCDDFLCCERFRTCNTLRLVVKHACSIPTNYCDLSPLYQSKIGSISCSYFGVASTSHPDRPIYQPIDRSIGRGGGRHLNHSDCDKQTDSIWFLHHQHEHLNHQAPCFDFVCVPLEILFCLRLRRLGSTNDGIKRPVKISISHFYASISTFHTHVQSNIGSRLKPRAHSHFRQKQAPSFVAY